MNKIEKMAQADAYEYALSRMFFGEGAGTRRKLIENTVAWNTERTDGYFQAFNDALNKLDQVDMAKVAIKEREKIDRAAKAHKNLRALKAGKLQNLSTGVYVGLVGYAFFYHTETGVVLRLRAERKMRDAYRKARRGFNRRDFQILASDD